MTEVKALLNFSNIMSFAKGMTIKNIFVQNGSIPLFMVLEDKKGIVYFTGVSLPSFENTEVAEYLIENQNVHLSPISGYHLISLSDYLISNGVDLSLDDIKKIKPFNEDVGFPASEYNFESVGFEFKRELIPTSIGKLCGEKIAYIHILTFDDAIEIVTESKKRVKIGFNYMTPYDSSFGDFVRDEKFNYISDTLAETFIFDDVIACPYWIK